MTQDSFTLDEGQVVLQYPTTMSPQSAELLEMFMNLLLKKLKDRAALQESAKESSDSSNLHDATD